MQYPKVNPNILYAELSYDLVGILYEVHNSLGRFCSEKQYADALENLLKRAGITFSREHILEHELSSITPARNKIDFLVNNKIVIELKAKHNLTRDDYLQAQRYLKTANLSLALLVNFRYSRLQIKRILNSQAHS